VSVNDSISLQPILSGRYVEFTTTTYAFNNEAPFYVGLYTGNTREGDIYTNPLFGWAQLVNVNGEIHLLNSALEYGGTGIYAGTLTIIPVPEPGILVPLGLGATALYFARRNKTSSRK